MPYRLTYSVNIDYVGPGTNVMSNNVALALPQGGRGGAQTLEISNSTPTPNAAGTALNTPGLPPSSLTFTSADITALLAAMSADLSTKMNAQIARVQGFATGGG
jgi:hypothetical protein